MEFSDGLHSCEKGECWMVFTVRKKGDDSDSGWMMVMDKVLSTLAVGNLIHPIKR